MNCKLFFILILLLGIAAALPVVAQARLSEWTPANGVSIRQGNHVEWFRGAESRRDRNEEEIGIVWSDTRYGDRGVYVQIIDTDGNFVFDEGGLQVADAFGRQEDPGIWPSSDGGWFIAWEDFSVDSTGDIYCTKLNSDHEIIWGRENPRRVTVCTAYSYQEGVRIVDDGDGGCIIAWTDKRHGDDGDIYAMHVLPNGQLDLDDWPQNGMVVVRAGGGQTDLTADSDGAGGMIIGWKDTRDEANSDIWAQRIDPNGEMLWGDGQGIQVCESDANQESPKLCPDGAGGAFFSWMDDRNFGETHKDIYAQRVASNGARMWSASGEALCTVQREQSFNRIVASRPGEAIVLWEDKRNNPDLRDVYAMRISGNNSLVKEWNPASGLAIVVNDTSNQQGARVFPDGEGGAYFIWRDGRDGGFPEVDIWAQRINLNGSLVWAQNGVPVCTLSGTQHAPIVRVSAAGGCVALWGDFRNGSQSIYAQRLNADNGSSIWEENGRLVMDGFGGNADDPIILPRHNGDATIVWLDGRGHDDLPYIQYVRDAVNRADLQLPAHGVPVIILDTPGGGLWPAAVNSDDGGVFVVWEDHRQGDYYSIYAQKMSEEGERLWGDRGVRVAEWDREQSVPYVCSDGEGGIIIAWKANTETFYFNLFMQRLNGNGERMWGDNGFRLTEHLMSEDIEALIRDPHSGGAAIVWKATNYETDDDIWMTRVTLDGEIDERFDDGEGGLVITNEEGIQRDAAITVQHDGFVIVWVSQDIWADGQTDIYGQLIEWDGDQRWRPNGWPICGDEMNQENPAVTFDADAFIWVVWEDQRNLVYEEDTLGVDIYMQKLRPMVRTRDDELFERDGRMVCGADRDQMMPDIIYDGQHGVWIAWEDYRSGIWSDIYTVHLNADGDLYGHGWEENGIIVTNAFHKQEKPKLGLLLFDERVGGETGVMMVWQDKRSTGKEELSNVYTQRIDDHLVSVQDNGRAETPHGYILEGAYPNPFNSQTIVRFVVPSESFVTLSLYDVTGRFVKRLTGGNYFAGQHQVVVNGLTLASGMYIVRLEANDIQLELPIQLLK